MANRLRELREDHHMSVEKLAVEMNVSARTIARWETGETTPAIEKLLQLEELFGMRMHAMMGWPDGSGDNDGERVAA